MAAFLRSKLGTGFLVLTLFCLLFMILVVTFSNKSNYHKIEAIATPVQRHHCDCNKTATNSTVSVTHALSQNDVKNATNKTLPNFQKSNYPSVIQKTLELPIINPFNYHFIHSPTEVCQTGNPKVVIAVVSAAGNFARRQHVRQGQIGAFIKKAENRAKMLFFAGTPRPVGETKNSIQQKLDQESSQYKDLVQSSFIEDYRNMSRKHMSILKWTGTFCNKITYVIKIDDDVGVQINRMVQALDSMVIKKKATHFILGNLNIGWLPHRNPKSKYYTSFEEFKAPVLPNFLLGGAIGYTAETTGLLFEATLRVPLFWLEDVYVSGLCANRVGVKLINDLAFKFTHTSSR